MIIDNQLVLSAEQDIVSASNAGTVASTNTIVVGKADFGYKGCFLTVTADEDIKTPATTGNLNVVVQADDVDTFASAKTVKIIAVPLTEAKAKGTVLVQDILRDVQGLKYVRLQYTGAGYVKNSGQSSLKVSAFITFDVPTK